MGRRWRLRCRALAAERVFPRQRRKALLADARLLTGSVTLGGGRLLSLSAERGITATIEGTTMLAAGFSGFAPFAIVCLWTTHGVCPVPVGDPASKLYARSGEAFGT
jgi:hypothetical protein